MTVEPNTIAKTLDETRSRIARACARSGRDPSTVKLIGVSKLQSVEAIRAAMDAGLRDFGENYAQELLAKVANIDDSSVRWHFLGGLQSNKVRALLPVVSSIHSIDRVSLVDELAKRADPDRPVDVFVEVSIADEAQKSGAPIEDVASLCERLLAIPGLRPVGLMAVPPADNDIEHARAHFRKLRELRDFILESLTPPPGALRELSMGMSADFEIAIEEGATIVRVGTAIFGTRCQT